MNLPLPKDKWDALAERLCAEVDASETAKGNLLERIQRTRALYNVESGVSTLNVVDDVKPYAMPLWRSKADRVKDSVVKTFTGVYPYVQVISEDTNSNDDDYERSLMCLADNSGFKRSFGRAFVECLNTDVGIMRVRPVYGKGDRLKGVESERIKVEFMVGYPVYVSRFDECATIGHRFFRPVRDIKRDMKADVYYDAELVPTSVQELLDSSVFNQKTVVDSIATTDDEYDMNPVRLYELITEEKIDGEWMKVLVVLAYDSRKILSVQEYDYPLDWYIEMRIDDEGDTLYPDNSLGQRVQALNQAFSDGYSTLFIGSLATAFPVIAIEGNIGGTKVKKWNPAMLLTLPQGVKANVLGTAFNPGAMPLSLQKIEEMTDAVVGISRMGTGQQIPSETREKAIEGMLSAQQEAKEGYADAVSPAVKKYFQLLDLFLVSHFWDFKAIYGDKIPLQSPDQVPLGYRLEVTGQNSSSSPQALMQKQNALYTMASQPDSVYSKRKVELKIGQTMDLPFDVKSLTRDEIDALMQMIAQVQEMGIPPEQAAQAAMAGLQQFVQQAQLQSEVENAVNEASRRELLGGLVGKNGASGASQETEGRD